LRKATKTTHMKQYTDDNLTEITGKAVPLQAWTGPEDFRKLRFPDFVTTALDDGRL